MSLIEKSAFFTICECVPTLHGYIILPDGALSSTIFSKEMGKLQLEDLMSKKAISPEERDFISSQIGDSALPSRMSQQEIVVTAMIIAQQREPKGATRMPFAPHLN